MNESKSEILTAAIERQKVMIEDLEKRTKDILANDGNVNEEEYDSTEQSIKSALIEEAEALKDELDLLRNEMLYLEKLKRVNKRFTTVEPGAAVTTNHGLFFVSASIEGFSVGKSKVFGISVESPLYKKMKGMKAGDKLRLKNTEYEIRHIY